MSFQDLPRGWSDQPITNHIDDVLDLLVDMRARMNGALMILVCDERYVPVQPIMIDDVPKGMLCDEMAEPLQRIASTIGEGFPGASALVALGRSGSSRVSLRDRAWATGIERAFAGQVELIGVHVVTPRGPVRIEAQADAA